MSATPYNIIFGTLLPILGNVSAVILFLSSVPNVYQIRRSKQLGDVNGDVYCVLLLSAIGWTAYGIQLKSITIGPLNFFGCIVMLWCSISYYTVIPNFTKQKYQYEILFYCCTIIPTVIAFIWTYSVTDYATQSLAAGSCAVAGYVVFLSSPLALIRSIWRTKNTSSLSVPLTIVNFINCCFWTLWAAVYTGDYFVYAPNAIGVGINTIFLSLILLYRNNSVVHLVHTPTHSIDTTDNNNTPSKPSSEIEAVTPNSKSDIPYSTMIDIESEKLERQDSISSVNSHDAHDEISVNNTVDGLNLRTTPRMVVRQVNVT